MKRSFYGLLGLLIFAANFVLVTPAFAGNPSKDTSALQSACSTLGGNFAVTNGSASGLSWTCNGMTLSGRAKDTGPLASACSTMGGNFSVNSANQDGAAWTCSGASSSGTANNPGGGGNTGGNTGGDTGGGTGGDTGGDTGGGTGGDTGSGKPRVVSPAPKVATEKCGGVSTSLIKCGNSSDGSAIFEILGIGLTIVTYGVGAAAVLGVVITGYQYMSARDNAAQVVKAKNRLLQVVIGLAIWVLFWGVLQFLLPGGLFANGS